MTTLQYRTQTLENIALQAIKNYNRELISGEPCAIPIEDMVEQHYGLSVEYQCLSKKGHILGLTVFEDSLVPVYNAENKSYEAIFVKGSTVLIDSRLLRSNTVGRLRFTFAHELAHFLIHKEYYMNNGETAAKTSKETDKITEREADILSAALLMPQGRVKIAFNRLRGQCTPTQAISLLAQIFDVSCQAMEIRLKSSNLI